MVKVALGFGAARAEEVAGKLRDFLHAEGLDVFLASPRSHDIPNGMPEEEQKQLIHQNFMDCNILVYVCADGTPEQQAVKEEVTFIRRNKLLDKLIIFSKSDDCIPKRLKSSWRPLHFAPEKPEESFSRLLNEIFRQHIRLASSAEMKPERVGEA
jgi:hypothetical protein